MFKKKRTKKKKNYQSFTITILTVGFVYSLSHPENKHGVITCLRLQWCRSSVAMPGFILDLAGEHPL